VKGFAADRIETFGRISLINTGCGDRVSGIGRPPENQLHSGAEAPRCNHEFLPGGVAAFPPDGSVLHTGQSRFEGNRSSARWEQNSLKPNCSRIADAEFDGHIRDGVAMFVDQFHADKTCKGEDRAHEAIPIGLFHG